MDEKSEAPQPDPKARRAELMAVTKARLGELVWQKNLIDREIAACEQDLLALEKMAALL